MKNEDKQIKIVEVRKKEVDDKMIDKQIDKKIERSVELSREMKSEVKQEMSIGEEGISIK